MKTPLTPAEVDAYRFECDADLAQVATASRMRAQTAVVTPRLFTESELEFLAEALGEAAESYDRYAQRLARDMPTTAAQFIVLAQRARAMQLEIEAR